MKAILSADRKWGLGYQGRLLVSIPSDLRFFRETTIDRKSTRLNSSHAR